MTANFSAVREYTILICEDQYFDTDVQQSPEQVCRYQVQESFREPVHGVAEGERSHLLLRTRERIAEKLNQFPQEW
jgi:hypothetical protein